MKAIFKGRKSLQFKYSIHLITLIIVYIFSIIGIYFSNNVILNVFFFLLIPFFAVILIRGDLVHPYTWFSIVFTLYSISHPVLIYYEATYDVYIYTKSLLLLEATSLTIILLIVGTSKINYLKELQKLKFEKKNNFIFYLFAVLISVAIIEVILSGYTHKSQIYNQGSIFIQVGFRVALLFIFVYAINQIIYIMQNNKMNKIYNFIFLATMFLIVIFSGERDIFLRAILIALFIYYIFIVKQNLRLKVIVIGILCILMIPLLKKFKYFGLSGQIGETNKNFIVELFYSDFAAASKNFQIILLSDYKSYYNGETYLWAVGRMLNLDNLFEINSIISWYNTNFFNENRAGQGFSILAEGYVNFGFIGVAFISIIMGLIMKLLYRISKKNVYYLVYYLLSIPVFMYSLRADFANLLLPLINQSLIFIILLIFMNDFTRQAGLIKKIKSNTKGENVT